MTKIFKKNAKSNLDYGTAIFPVAAESMDIIDGIEKGNLKKVALNASVLGAGSVRYGAAKRTPKSCVMKTFKHSVAN